MKKKTLYRLSAFLLAVIMIIGAMPTNVFAARCRHTGGKHWVNFENQSNHVQICDECGARIKTEDHDVTDDSQWDFVYLDVDYDMSGGGTHQQICKKCGYTYYNDHFYEKRTVKLNGANHPNVLICSDPKCNHIKEYDGNGRMIYNHAYWTKYVNFDNHVTLCAYCGYAPGQVYQHGFQKVEHVDYSKLDEYYVFANNGAYKLYKYLSDAEKKLYKTFYTLELGMQSHKADQRDYEKHSWYEVRNASSHWMECHGCHATYDKAGHHFETSEDDNQGFGPCCKTTYCETCGWVKSIKISDERNKAGTAWVNFEEKLKTLKDVLDYNGCPDEQPKPGHGGDVEPCKHPEYYIVYGPNGEERVDNFYYLNIGGRHEKRCGYCNATLSTSGCNYHTETFEEVRHNWLKAVPGRIADLGADYTPWLYMEDYFKSGHYKVCSVCGGKVSCPHNWGESKESDKDICKRTCKDCGFTITYRWRSEGSKDPSPHTYLTYQDNYWTDANQNIHDPDSGCCSYTFVGGESTHRHKAKCEVCGYTHTEKCDTLGWCELPGQPGKHLRFCSKCGGGKTVVSCGTEYWEGNNLPAGFHAIRCPECGDTYIPKTPCDFIIDEKNTDAFIHTYKCTYCGFEWHDNHIRKTIKTNFVPATATADGHYDLVTYCEVCNKEIARSTITIPKADNPTALGYVEAVYTGTTENRAHLGSGSSFLNGTMVMDGVAEYLANNSATLLSGVTFDPSHDIWVNGKKISANSTTRIVLCANARMVVTDYTQDEDDLDGDNDKDEYTSMTANVGFTYSAYYVTTLNGVDYRDSDALINDQPLDLSGAPITMTLPLLTGLSSNQTMFVRQTTDNGANYTTYLGDFDSDWGMGCVTFTTENGFDGEFLFVPTEHWLEHVERQEATDQTDGNIEYWYDRGTHKYYSDILCEHEITKSQTYLNANTYTISFAPGGGSGSAPASVTGVHKQEDVTLPACTYTNPGYVFYGWSDGDWTYKAGSLYTVRGDAELTAKWHLPGDTMCHITFHPNGDNVEGTMDEQVCAPDDVIRLQENGYTREGYTFYGWSTTSERQVPPYAFDKGTISPGTDLDLYAIWCPTYYITFDANGGVGEMEPQAYYSTPLLPGDGWYVPYAGLVQNSYTRDGYKFKYWATNPDGSGNTYTDGGVSPMDTTNPKNITLYAIWEQTRFTVTFDANCSDATGQTASMQIDAGIWDVIPQCGYERDGYVFVKWAENPDGTGNTTYKPGLLRSFAQNKTLYAIWQKTRTITFNGNGADNTMPAQVVKEGESTKLSDFTFVKDGYQTVTYCWNTEPDGTGTKYYDGQSVTLSGDLTLYAQWKKTKFTITYDANGGEGEQYTQTADFGEGYSSVCPRCSTVYTHTLSNGINVNYCNCCGFALTLKDDGSTDNLATRSYGSMYDYNLPTKFDNLASLYAAFTADRTEENYTAFYEKANEILDGSISALTKDLDYSASDGALIGIDSEYRYTLAETDRTYADILAATANLYGYDDTAKFVQYAQSVAAVYHANEIGATTSYRLKYTGAVYTSNGSFILPYAFKTNLGDATLLSFVIVDADGGVSVWLSDLNVLFSITAYNQELPENSNTTIDVYGCCELYENPRALGNEFTKDRYVFSKWNTEPDGSGMNYTAGSTTFSSSLTGDLTLYAIWTPDFFTVTFDANGGEGTMEPQVIDRNVPTPLNKNTFTREGYLFLGWGSSATATYGYNDEATYTSAYTYNVKLYARWAKAVTITFNAGEGFGVMEPQIVAENTYTALKKNTFMHETKGFNYWSLTPNGDRAYTATSSVRLTEDTTLYAVWKNKTDASSKITFEDASFPYTGEVQNPELTLADFTQYSDPKTYFLYYNGTDVSRDNLLSEAPTDVGVYTVRAIYEDSIYKGYKDATLTITKTGRDLVPTSSLLMLYGKDKSIALRLSDGDNTAISDLTVTSADESVVVPRTDEIYKDRGLVIVPFTYVGEGYTTVTFTLPETANYEAANATITVLSKSGYNVTVAAADEFGNNAEIVGGTVTADKPIAPAGEVVHLTAQAKPGYTFDGFTVVNDTTGQNVEVENNNFIMPEANVTISAEFTQNEYAVTYAAVDGVTYGDLPTEAHYGDVITLSGSTSGSTAIKAYQCTYSGTSFTVTPDQNGVFRFIMPANDVTVTAVTGAWYDVSVSTGISGGSVATSVNRAFEGMTVKVMPSANSGYTVGSLTYTAGGVTKPVSFSVGSDGSKIYSIIMPAGNIIVNALFIPDTTLNGAINSVGDIAGSEIGESKADIAVNVDNNTAAALKDAASAVDVSLTASGSKNLSNNEKAAAIGALAQAGLVNVETNGTNVSVKNADDNSAAEIRVVEKTYLEVTVKEFAETGDDVLMTLDITPMKQTVATAVSEGTKLDSENSAPLSEAEKINVTEMTHVTVGIPKAMAIAAGGAGSTVYIGHTHNGKTFEYPAVIEGNDTDGYTASFDNPNGYSEFTVSAQTNTVASFDHNNTTYYYPSFKEAIADAIKKNVTNIVMHKMPTGEDYATITKQITLTFEAATGAEDKIDFNALYTDWILTDDGIKKSSTPVQLPLNIFAYVKTDTDDYPEYLSFYAASLTLQNNLKVNFYVNKDLIVDNDYESPFAVFEMNGKTVTVREYSEVTSGGDDYYVFSFADIAPNLMNDTITATLHATFEDTEYVSDPLEYSISTYCYSMLGKTDNEKLRTLLVDLLNYGAAAQTYTGYNTNALANTSLTSEQTSWGTASDPDLTSVTNAEYHTVSNPSVNWAGASLRLNDSVTMQFVFTADNTDGVTVRIENGSGTLLQEITASEFISSGGYYIAAYNGLTAGQMSETVYATAYRGGEAISNTVAYSVESYAYAKQNDANTDLAALVKAMMKYGNAAYAYVH